MGNLKWKFHRVMENLKWKFHRVDKSITWKFHRVETSENRYPQQEGGGGGGGFTEFFWKIPICSCSKHSTRRNSDIWNPSVDCD